MAMDLYQILGVARGAHVSDIRRAYRRLARRYHPGVNPGDREAQARYGQISLAFETLNDPERRRAYDAGAEAGPAAGETFSFGFEGFDFSVAVPSEHQASTFGDLFAGVLARAAGGSTGSGTPEAGADLHVAATVSFGEALRGTDCYVPMTRHVPCRTCTGTGALGVDPMVCSVCQGRGQVRSARGHMVFVKRCDTCQGRGQLSQVVCRTCHGQGVEARAESGPVRLPAGLSDGDQVRLAALGHCGRQGGRPGDLVITVHVTPHPLFRREGNDLHVVVPVAVHEAALGAKIEIPTVDGSVRLRVPPGTPSGQRLRVRARGAPSIRTGGRGDLIVEIRVVLPPLLDERSKELLREFGQINGENVRQGLWDSVNERVSANGDQEGR
ncbi:MAG TPA: J domain-containing protein [Vicinamibacterales bacterium]|jgi:molecular chaperone DnaJ